MVFHKLPFDRIAAQAIIVRRKDGAILGALHQLDDKFSPPGGALRLDETPTQALTRIFEEEHILLIAPDVNWESRLAVDFFQPANQLNIYYLFLVDEFRSGPSPDWVDLRWLDQSQDVWYPQMREKILLAIQEYTPDMLKVEVSVLESW